MEEEIGLHLRKNLITKKHFDPLTNIDDAVLEYFIDCTFYCQSLSHTVYLLKPLFEKKTPAPLSLFTPIFEILRI